MAIVLVGAILMSRGSKLIPGRGQNVFECVLRVPERLRGRPRRAGGRPYIPIFVAFFLLILFYNWIGLVPPVGRIELLRAPSSDVNITIGLALVSFLDLPRRGLPPPRRSRLPRQVLPDLRVQATASAPAIIAMFVGLVELMLEFVKPVTLSMRFFGNIYGGEVALGVITALTIAIIPVGADRAGGDAQRDPGAHLQRPDPHVHRARDREPPRRGRPRRRGGDRRRSTATSRRAPARPLMRATSATTTVPMNPGRPLGE